MFQITVTIIRFHSFENLFFWQSGHKSQMAYVIIAHLLFLLKYLSRSLVNLDVSSFIKFIK